jgi:hypothetical protein
MIRCDVKINSRTRCSRGWRSCRVFPPNGGTSRVTTPFQSSFPARRAWLYLSFYPCRVRVPELRRWMAMRMASAHRFCWGRRRLSEQGPTMQPGCCNLRKTRWGCMLQAEFNSTLSLKAAGFNA